MRVKKRVLKAIEYHQYGRKMYRLHNRSRQIEEYYKKIYKFEPVSQKAMDDALFYLDNIMDAG